MKKKLRSAFLLESLEARLLFSADMAPLPMDGGNSGAEVESGLEISLRPDNGGVQEADTNEHLRQEIIFVDEAVDDFQQLIVELESQREKGRRFDIVGLDSDRDGIAQISAYLSQQQNVDAVHIISHGTDGEVILGTSRLNSTTLDGYAEAIEGWQQALTGDADLLFYGCNLAAGDDGQDLVNSLTLLTGADVAASEDVTGSAKFGGDWVLEYAKGEIETAVAINSETQQNWNGVLATYNVTTTTDGGPGSLRLAILDANDSAEADVIILPSGTYLLSLGELEITSELTITGADAGTTIIDGNDGARVFHLIGDAANLTLNDLTVQGGNSNKGSGIYVDHNLAQLTAARVIITENIAGNGAGIFNDGTMTLTDVVVSSNGDAGTHDGGGIHNTETANLNRVIISDNRADDGGGIFNDGTMTLTDVVISNNGDAATNEGGGIHNKKVAILERVTISGNRADKSGGDGGGIHNDGTATSLSLTNVTFSGNSASDKGGGLHTEALVTIVNSTFTLNSATTGGGISQKSDTVNTKNTIVAENSASTDPDVEGSFNSQGYNLIGDKGTVTDFTSAGDQVGTGGSPLDPMLGILQDNGGFTLTHALLAGSPAIDPIGLSGALPLDQRGASRDGLPDIGAFEFGAAIGNNPGSVTIDNTTPAQGDILTANVTDPDGASGAITYQWYRGGVAITGATSSTYTTVQLDVGTAITVAATYTDDLGAAESPTSGATAAVANSNDAPTATNLTSTSSYNEGDATVAITDIVVSDVDSGETITATLTLNNTATGSLSANDGATYDGGTGVWTITDTLANVNLALANLVFTPLVDNDVDTTITTHIQDAAGAGPADGTITLDVTPVNDAPVINNATFVLDENSANSTAVGTVPVTDPDAGDTHVYSITAGNTGGAFAIDNAGNITVANSAALNFETTPVFTLTVQAQDQGGTGLIDTATITVNLNDINDAPVINNATFNVDENSTNSTAVGTVPVTDPDAGDTHVYSITAGNTGGAFAIDNAGNITVANSSALNFETTPVFTLTVAVQDQGGTGLTDTATITVNLNDLNEAPVINDATFNVDENSTIGTAVGTVPVTDPDAGDTHVYTITAGNTDGAFAIDNAGNITVANSAALNFETTPVFTLTVQVQDQGGTGLTDTATITVNLNDLNETPVINNATFNVDENSTNGTAVGTVPVTDPDAGDTHVYSITAGNTGGAFAIDNAGNITVANSAALNFETTPVFTLTVQVQDQGGTGLIDTATITVNLNDLNEVPVINNATFNVDENSTNGTAVGALPVTDPDAGDTHVYSITAGNTGGAFTIDNAGNITVANSAALDFETTPVFTLTVEVQDQGGTGLTDTATITVNLNDLNEVPVINNATFNVDENATNGNAVGTVLVTDPDAGDTHVYSITAGNTGGAFAIDNAGNITVANSAALNFETTPVFTLTVQVQDQGGTGLTDTATITVNLNDLNEVPVINNATFNVDENSTNGTAVGTVPVTDPDTGDTHVYSITAGNTGGAFAIDNAGNITVANSAVLNSETTPVFTLTVQVQDQGGTGLIDTATITVNLNDLNEVPVINNATFNVDENSTNGTAVGALPVTDPDAGDTHVYSITAGNTGGAFTIDNAGNITVANSAALDFETTPVFTLTVQVQDQGGTGLIDIATITVNLNDINDAGTVTIDNTIPTQGDTLTANVIDPDGASGAISFQWFSDGAAIGGATGKTYTTTQADVGTIITVTTFYTDDQGTVESPTSAGTAPVMNVNETPVAVNDNLNATEDQSITFTSVTDLLSNDTDIDGDALTISGFTQPANGMLVDNGDGTLTYTPAGNFNGTDNFTYTISDGNGEAATGTAIIVVTPVGDTPQVSNVSTNAETQSGLIFINRNANDGSEVTHFKLSGITNGSLYLSDGVTRIDNGDFITVAQGQAGLRFTPAPNSTDDGSFNVESSEDGVSVASQSGIATSIITILTPAPQPSVSEHSPLLSEPEPVTDEEVVEEESEDSEDVADETDVQADADNLFSVETPQSSKAPGTTKPSFNPGISFIKRADSNSDDDKTPDSSTLVSPQTLKLLLDAKNLGELKTALGKLDITTLSPDAYDLMRNSLDAVKEEIDKEMMLDRAVLGSAIATSVGLSAGYVVWMLKGGSLLTSVLSSLPVWQLADPLAILVGKKDEEDDEEDDSLKTIIEESSGPDDEEQGEASKSDNIRKESLK